MSELTKEVFQQELKKLATKDDIKEAVSELASTAKRGFDSVDKRFDEMDERLTIVEHKLDRALYHELDRHERWIKQLAQKVGVQLTNE